MKTKRMMWISFGVVFLAACASSPSTTVAPSPITTEFPTEVPTQPTSAATITACDPAQFIDVLRESLTYEESVVNYNYFDDTANLTAWFVDPELDPTASVSEVQDLSELTFHRSADVVHRLAVAEPCVVAIFDSVTVIAVDQRYHAWYVGAIPAWEIPITETMSEDERTAFEGEFTAEYQRAEEVPDDDPSEIPGGSCTWPKARQDMAQVFAQAQLDASLYYYIVPDEASVYIQWDIPPEVQNASQVLDYFFLPLPSIDRAISCLYPKIDTLWLLYIRQDGEAQWVFAVDGDAVRDDDYKVFTSNLELMYQATEGTGESVE